MTDVYKSIEEYSKEEEKEPLKIPLEGRRLVTMPYDYSIEVLFNQFKDKRLVVEEEGFQRKYVWDDIKASSLIESLILNVPIPVCYFSEEESGIYSVIDGHQRIKSIYRFIDNQFSLKGLKVVEELNKKKFFELPLKTQRQIYNRTIRCIVLLQESHPDLKFDIFERLNTGSVSLNAQELRNCIYRGPFNDLVKQLVKHSTWLKALGAKNPHKRMLDREMIVRFFALSENLKHYKKPMKTFLGTYMRDANKYDDSKITKLRDLFTRTIEDVYFVLGTKSFRRYSNGRWEYVANKALFDVIMVSFADTESMKIRQKKDDILNAYKEIQASDPFSFYIAQSTSDVNFFERLNEIKVLLDGLESEDSTQIDWKKNSALIRSCIVLLSSHFEAFFEEIVSEYIDFLNSSKLEAPKIPKSVKATQVDSELKVIAETTDWTKRVNRIENLFSFNHALWTKLHVPILKSDLITKDFNNPGSKQIERLFSYLDINSFFKKIGLLYKKLELEQIFEQTVNSFVSIRNKISHGEPTDCRQTKDDILRYINFFTAIALATDKIIGRELKKLCKIRPWCTSFAQRKRQFKKLGFS